MRRPDRIFHHYEDLEEYHAGMWRIVRGQERQRNIAAAAELMRNPDQFKAAMQEAVKRWPRSCEANLTAESVNRIAWLGHAGCCIGAGSPEENTRAGWHTLSLAEMDEANRVAGEVLDEWVSRYRPQTAQLDLLDWLAENHA